ncbi:MAG TPA: ATP-binding protein [Hanamia sp.]|nr:ATP-binding protein [Hanamia sp.]
MKKIITIILAIFSVTNLCAQNNVNGQTAFPPAYEITTDTISHNTVLPDSNWQMIADPSGKMTLEQALQPGSFKDTIRKINYRDDTYWLRYRIVNRMQKEAKITFRPNSNFEINSVSRVDLYIKTNGGKWEHLKTGNEVPWSERDGLRRFNYINTVIPAGKEIVVYERDYLDYVFVNQVDKKSVSFGFTETIVQNDYLNDDFHYIQAVEYAFILGLFVFALVINFYFFITVREKEFLYFALFLLASALSNMWYLQDSILREHPLLQSYLMLIANVFIFFFLIYFIRYFLKTFKRFPRWDRWLVILAFLPTIIYLFNTRLSWLFHTNLSTFSIIIGIGTIVIISISLLITFLLYIRGHDKSIRLMIVAVAPFICLYVLMALFVIVFEVLQLGFKVKNPPALISFFFSDFRLFSIVSYAWMVLVFSWVLFMRFSSLRKKVAMQEVEKEKERNALIAQQKIELEKQVTERTSELQQSLENLKSTQKQLIQSEKMASLGELTAGIAHEIQNPLNFVNNFSDVNVELIDEMKNEFANGNGQEAIAIADDIKENEQKINHHGKRAGDIVKGMLQHSRTSTGVKEPTDINALADEYLRLSYHGLRAKDKSFNAEMKTDFDPSIGKINIIPQDIGRVLLNLYNNAFYAVEQKQKEAAEKGLPTFERLATLYDPTVSVTTMKSGNQVIITVSDNGNGIPQKIVDKIFQPFFTTKPTGSGTGLGLSLSYDIVKAHGGEIKVESKENEGSTFIINIPVTN